MDRALDPQDRRRAMWVWPSIFVCGFWMPLWLLLKSTTAPGALARIHAKGALTLFVVISILNTLWVWLIRSGGGFVGWLFWGLTTGTALIVAGFGFVSASRAQIEST